MRQRKSGNSVPLFAAVITVVVGIQGCQPSGNDEYLEQWTQDRRENAVHFIESLTLVIDATEISNRAGPGMISGNDIQTIAERWDHAVIAAEAVRDDVLDLIHPELRERFRDQFEGGLRLRLHNVVAEDGDISTEIEGNRLLDS